ncbi:Cation-dependent mannose-6-phosphate receptor [Mizuhopecten yessoensis]|uniref:Cation-dependent mannose-6-phosphate receptor n=2 Tax=Mizuhopecten yessoensis TaxID=6573 RepID=A0A210QNZ8_MIZYE|nr:Cation-dependent mannose-6-phosphate receptor [Mizuhopecten yessoensis]
MDSSAYVISILVLWMVISLSSPVLSAAEPCIKTGPCTCVTKQFTVDLTPLSTPTPRFQANDDKYTYIYSPCIPTGQKCGESTVTDIAICQELTTDHSTNFIVGTQSSAKFSGSPDNGSLQIEYTATIQGVQRTTYISVVCSDEDGSFSYLSSPSDTSYKLQLKTKYACLPCGLSAGSVLLIIFFVLLIVYIIGGILFMRYVRKAQGIEMIPNREMWMELPLLIKDGILFVSRGCKTDSSYSQI